MGTSRQTNTTEPVSSMLQSYTQYLPGLIQATAPLQTNVAQGQLAATQATQPGYDLLNLQQLQQFGIPLAEAGQAIQRSNALAGGDINRAQIAGSGGQAALEAAALARQVNPNFYGVQDAASQQAQNLLGAINLGGLSGGEQAAVERSLAQSNVRGGNLGLQNATNQVANAMNFGGAYNQKLGMLGNALGAANQTAASAQNTGFNPVNIALGQPNASTMSNFGTGTFTNTTPQTQNASAGNLFSMGNNFMGGIMNRGLANNRQSNQMSGIEAASSIMQGVGSICCFILLQYGDLPWYVRKNRDRYYHRNPQIARGYKRMAKWLVPAMQASPFVKWFVKKVMVGPIIEHGAFVRRVKGGVNHKHVRKFWFSIWNKLGA